MTQRVLVTGIAGFIGTAVAQRLLASGNEVIGIDDLSTGRIGMVPSGADFVNADLTKSSVISKLPRDIEQIFHLAGQSSGEISFDDPISDLEKNTVSTLNLIKYAIETKVEKILYASPMSDYESRTDAPVSESAPLLPLSCYGVGELASKNYLTVYSSSVPSVSLRMFNVHRPGQDMSNLRQGMISIYLAPAMNIGPNIYIDLPTGLRRFVEFLQNKYPEHMWYLIWLPDAPISIPSPVLDHPEYR